MPSKYVEASAKAVRGESKTKLSHLEIPISSKATGHVVVHHFDNSSGPGYMKPESHAFSEEEGGEALKHIAGVMGIQHAEPSASKEEKAETKGGDKKEKDDEKEEKGED
jgi:hypothetical protein